MKKLHLVVAAVLALSGSSAFAATLTGPTPTNGASASDLFLVVVNQSTGKTEVVDLGLAATALTNGKTFSVDPNLATNLGTGTLNYQIVGGDTTVSAGSFATYSGNVLYTTTNNIGAITWQGGSVNQGLAALNLWFSDIGAGGSSNWNTIGTGANAYQTFVSGGAATTGNWGPVSAAVGMPGNNLNLTGFTSSAAVGTAISLYGITTGTATDVSTTAATTAKLGTFTLTGSTLSFSNVPVPAALWLLASGILGLGAAGRRRKIAA